MTSRPLLVLALILAGCGSDDDHDQGHGGFERDQTCGVKVTLGDALVASLSGDETEAACAFPLGSNGIDTTFLPIAGEPETFRLEAAGIAKEATGMNFSAQVEESSRDGREWNTSACSVDVTEHEFLRTAELGDHYRVVGSGRCSTPARPVGGNAGTVAIGPFDFVVVTSWLGSR
jgi:hypothetical protein